MSDVVDYRLAAFEKRADAADARMQHVESLLTDIRMEMVNIRSDLRTLPSKAALWGMIGTTVAIAVALIAVFVSVLTYLQAFHLPR
jgi:hypothetical protein